MKKEYIFKKNTTMRKALLKVFLVIICFSLFSSVSFADNYTEIPERVQKFANKHNCTDLKARYKTKDEQKYNKEYDFYSVNLSSKHYNMRWYLIAKGRHVRFASNEECICLQYKNMKLSPVECSVSGKRDFNSKTNTLKERPLKNWYFRKWKPSHWFSYELFFL